MGFRYQKRIKLGKGFELNISKSGVKPNFRSKKGSISTKGYSIKTGIPGLTYRKKINSGCMVIILVFVVICCSLY